MKKISQIATGMIVASLFPLSCLAEPPNQSILPDDMKVYYNRQIGLTLKPTSGSAEKTIPTSSEFKDIPGCYLSCISKNAKVGIYALDDHAYLAGQIRVKGRYTDGYCIPSGYENKDARTAKELKEKCQETFPERCANRSCFIGTNTAAWF